MDKQKLTIAVSLLLLILIAIYSLSSKKVKSIVRGVKTETIAIDHKSEPKIDPKIVNQITKTLDKEKYYLFNSCGINSKQFYLSYDSLDLKLLKEDDLKSLNNILTNCETWFNELALLSKEDLEALTIDLEKKAGIVKELTILNYDPKVIDKARIEINNSDIDISFSALFYLLGFDHKFVKEIARQMDTNNHEFLIQNNNLATLFHCQQGGDCSAGSVLMQGLCEVNDNACDLSYSAWLRSGEITLNQYDDLMRALEATNRILNSDWFIENPVEYP